MEPNSSTSSSSPWRFAARVAAAGAFFSVLYVAMVGIAANIDYENQQRLARWTNLKVTGRAGDSSFQRLRELRNTRDIDVLFLGSSHCYRSFDTAFYKRNGIRAFNLGSTSQAPVVTRWLVERNLDRLNPKVIVYEAYVGNFVFDGVESYFDFCLNAPLDAGLVSLGIQLRDFRAINSLLARVLDRDRPPLKLVTPRLQPHDFYVSGGYVRRSDARTTAEFEDVVPSRVRPEQLDELAAIIQEARKRDIPIIFVVQPIPKSTRAALPGLPGMEQRIAEFAAEHEVPLFRYEGLPLNDMKHYFDDDHLNEAGVEIFGASVYRTLTDAGYLPKR